MMGLMVLCLRLSKANDDVCSKMSTTIFFSNQKFVQNVVGSEINESEASASPSTRKFAQRF